MKERIEQLGAYKRIKELLDRYDRFVVPGMLLIGFLVDFITFRTIEVKTAFTILTAYAVLAGLAIFYLNTAPVERETERKARRFFRLFFPLALQFTFGALLSASLVFYWFSGTLSASWPVLILLAGLMVSNEAFREAFRKPVVQISVYFFILFSLFSLILPYVFNTISPFVFFIAGVFALAIIIFFIQLLSSVYEDLRLRHREFKVIIAAIFLSMNGLYFFGVIPPIPLSLQEAGVYHSVSRVGEVYTVEAEEESLIDRLLPGQTIHAVEGQRVYVFSSVFAPADLTTRIAHEWQYYNEASREWVTTSRPVFAITGGREGGYRGFSFSNRTNPGKWRVDVETERGQLLGRVRFTVSAVEAKVETEYLIK